jgi:hypothetical protein
MSRLSPSRLALAGTAALALFVWIQSRRQQNTNGRIHAIVPSPLETAVSNLSPVEIAKLAYSPDYLPGGRDVESPWGKTRVYEFGPEDGEKVLFVHGISTPCISLGGLARHLAGNGCRVMLYGKDTIFSINRCLFVLLSITRSTGIIS